MHHFTISPRLTSRRFIFKQAGLFALFLLSVNCFTIQATEPTHFNPEKAIETTEFTESTEIKSLPNNGITTARLKRSSFINAHNSVGSVPSVVLDPVSDVFAFSNDTVFTYGTDEAGHLTARQREIPAEFSHRCFVLARGVMQFHQFARFAPEQSPVTSEEYRRKIKQICRIPVWWPALSKDQLIVIPGYRNLQEFSKAHEHLLKEELGNWFPTYIRIGNWRMSMCFPRIGQKWAAERLTRALDEKKLQAVYLARNLHMNHCVVLYGYHRQKNGDLIFDLYDPNYPGEKGRLFYHADERSFDFPKRWFWTGGRVNLMRVYLTPWH